MSSGGLALFFILTVVLYSKMLYVIHNVLLEQDTAFIYYWGNAKKMNFPLGTSNCQRNDCRSENVLDNNPVNMKYTPRKENAWHVCGRVSCISKASWGWFGLFD